MRTVIYLNMKYCKDKSRQLVCGHIRHFDITRYAFQSVKKEIGASWNILHVIGVVEHVEYWQFQKYKQSKLS